MNTKIVITLNWPSEFMRFRDEWVREQLIDALEGYPMDLPDISRDNENDGTVGAIVTSITTVRSSE